MRTLLTSTLLQVGRAKFSSSLGSSLHKDFYPAAPRALMNCPILHSLEENVSSNIGTFYSIPSANFSRILTPIVKPEFARQLQVFNDYSFLIRQPAIDMIQKIRKIRDLANNSHRAAASEHLLAGAIVPRFVLHGQPGSGISVQMAHVAHFAASENWLIFHFSDKEKWLDKNPDKVPSCELHQKQHQTSEHPGNIFDLPARSVTWLNKFISMNKPTLEKWNPVLSRSVEWASSDILPIGTPWIEVIDYAIKRSKYASDCIGILLREVDDSFFIYPIHRIFIHFTSLF
ncbi:unnamed protein product [Protopolystoma xenopodis]|uniref:Small ribosomal subunit protein mS29 n=1 Tax=Protopolystoma xenopodis TaxID=117903 RepID=A0A3S5BPR8_9PLAT|nr:unnamed protein product [Protopolystoma xenopodis]